MSEEAPPDALFHTALIRGDMLFHFIAGICGISQRGCFLVNEDGMSLNVRTRVEFYLIISNIYVSSLVLKRQKFKIEEEKISLHAQPSI